MDQEQFDAAVQCMGNLMDKKREKASQECLSNYKDSISDIWERIKEYSTEHPLITVCLLIVIGLSAIPITCFATFVIGTMIVTFTGFVVVEGILLSFGVIILGIALSISSFFAVAFCGCFLASWYALDGSKKLMQAARKKIDGEDKYIGVNKCIPKEHSGVQSTPISTLQPETNVEKEEIKEKE